MVQLKNVRRNYQAMLVRFLVATLESIGVCVCPSVHQVLERMFPFITAVLLFMSVCPSVCI